MNACEKVDQQPAAVSADLERNKGDVRNTFAVTIRKKLVPIIFLRASKAAAILCNAGFGYAFLGWNLG